jgi:hypothetical protein
MRPLPSVIKRMISMDKLFVLMEGNAERMAQAVTARNLGMALFVNSTRQLIRTLRSVPWHAKMMAFATRE